MFQSYDDNAAGSPTLAAFFGGLGATPTTVYPLASDPSASASTIIAGWLKDDSWSAGQYNAYMYEMYQTILLWDKIGWQKGCWNDATRRARWVIFMNGFGKHYKEHGNISSASYLDDSEEAPAHDFAKQLAAWGNELNASCAANIPQVIPPPPGPNGDSGGGDSTFDLGSALKWGALLVGGVLALQLITAFKGATR
jgi:hypothetical protein